MLFNFKSSRFISVVLASSAFCSNSLVSANTELSSKIIVHSMYDNVDSNGNIKIKDDEKLLRFIMNKLYIASMDKIIEHYQKVDIKNVVENQCFQVDYNYEQKIHKSFYLNSDKNYRVYEVTFETYFRYVLCKCFEALNRERLLKVGKLLNSIDDYGKNRLLYMSFLRSLVERVMGSYKYGCSERFVLSSGSYIFASEICEIFDNCCKNFKDEKSRVEFWDIMANSFKDFLVDLSDKSFDNKQFNSKDYKRIIFSHCFGLAINIMRSFGVDIKEGKDSYAKYLENINKSDDFVERFSAFLSDKKYSNQAELILGISQSLLHCMNSFGSFVSDFHFCDAFKELL